MIGVSGFIGRVRAIASRPLTYRTGGVGSDGTCDCIGLIMGAMYELGRKKYDMHSTNYFARFQTMEMVTLKSGTNIYPGMILYKAKDDTDNLNGRYMPGGRYYTGDVLDYYHVGVVLRVKPLEIVECTTYKNGSGIVHSSTIQGWDYGGKLRGVLYDGYYEEENEPKKSEAEETMSVLYKARVATNEGTLNLRSTPGGKKIGELPKGAEVDVYSEGEWARVAYGEMLGHVSSEYLEKVEPEQEPVKLTTLIKDDGTVIALEGVWRVAED